MYLHAPSSRVILAAAVLAVASIAALGSGASAAPGATTFLPGLYETVTTDEQGSRTTARSCASAKAVTADTLEKRLAAMSRNPGCRFTQRSIGGGKYAIAADCSSAGARSSYRQTGTYTPTGMTMKMAMTMQVAPGQKPVSYSFSSVSRRVAATCPAGMSR